MGHARLSPGGQAPDQATLPTGPVPTTAGGQVHEGHEASHPWGHTHSRRHQPSTEAEPALRYSQSSLTMPGSSPVVILTTVVDSSGSEALPRRCYPPWASIG